MACSKHGLRVVWLESLPLGIVWPVLNSLNDRFVARLWLVLWPGLWSVHNMLRAWFKVCLAEILALMDYLDNAITYLNDVLWPVM